MNTPRAAVAVAALVLLAGAGCGDDKEPVQQQVVDQAQFCGNAIAFRDAAATAGVVVPAPTGVPVAAARTLVDAMGERLDAMADQAPSEVRGDVEEIVESLQEAGDGESARLAAPAFEDAWRAVEAYRGQVCETSGSSEGDG